MDSTTHITAYLTGRWPDRTGLGVHYARVMAAALARYAPQAEFTVFTDQALPGINTRPIPALSGFFGRLYQFSPEAFPRGTRVLSLDLDTAILGDLTPILTMDLSQIVGLGAFGPRHDWARPLMGNGLMSWIAGPKYWPLWTDFPKGVRGTDETWTRSVSRTNGAGWTNWCPTRSCPTGGTCGAPSGRSPRIPASCTSTAYRGRTRSTSRGTPCI